MLSFRTVGASLCMFGVGVAGIAKLSDLHAFRASLDSWVFLPTWTRPSIVAVVPATEVALATAWVVTVSRRHVAVAALGMLLLFTIAYALHVALGAPPTCQCFGKILAFEQGRTAALWTIARNALMVLMLAVYLLPKRQGSAVVAHVAVGSRGFTLIELMVVIAITGVLIGLSVNVLAKARERGRDVQTLARFASAQKGVMSYTSDYHDVFPCLVSPVERERRFEVDGGTVRVLYFEQYQTWPLGLAESYLGVPWSSPVLQPSGSVGGTTTAIWYSHNFLTSPEYWNRDQREGVSQWRATRTSDVLFPSGKACFVLGFTWELDRNPDIYHRRLISSACDGSSRWRKFEEFYLSITPGADAVAKGSLDTWWPGMTTLNGLRGRDYSD